MPYMPMGFIWPRNTVQARMFGEGCFPDQPQGKEAHTCHLILVELSLSRRNVQTVRMVSGFRQRPFFFMNSLATQQKVQFSFCPNIGSRAVHKRHYEAVLDFTTLRLTKQTVHETLNAHKRP